MCVVIFVLAYSLVIAEEALHMPPVLGMMADLGFLKFYGYYLKRRDALHSSLPRKQF